MVSEDKLTAFLTLQQIVLDLEDSTQLLEQFLPKVLDNLLSVGYPYIFLSPVFIDTEWKIKQIFFTDKNTGFTSAEVIKWETLFKKGSEWEMKVMYGEAAVVADVASFINPTYQELSKIHSLLIIPIQQSKKLSGIFVLASAKEADKIDSEEIEFGEMISRLIDLAFRLQDTEKSLTKITQQVYEANAKLHQMDKLKDDFVSIASHELRTPMTAIRSYAWMALHKSDVPLSEKLEKYLIRVLISTERLINLVNDMLNLSRIESGRIEIKPEAVDSLSLVKDIIDELYYSKSQEKQSEYMLTYF